MQREGYLHNISKEIFICTNDGGVRDKLKPCLTRFTMIAGNAEGILSRVAIDPGVGIRRSVRVLRRRRRDIRRPAAAAAAATSGLQARSGVLVGRTCLLLAVHPMRPRLHPEPLRGAQGRDLRLARARLRVRDAQVAVGGRRGGLHRQVLAAPRDERTGFLGGNR